MDRHTVFSHIPTWKEEATKLVLLPTWMAGESIVFQDINDCFV